MAQSKSICIAPFSSAGPYLSICLVSDRQSVLLLANSFNYQCSHQQVCHPRCFRRQARACHRMLSSVRKIYGDEPHQEALEFLSYSKKSRHHKDEKKDKSKGQSRPGSPLRRRDSLARKDR